MEVKFGAESGSAPAPQVETKTETQQTPVSDVTVESTTTVAPTGSQLPATRKFLLGDKLPRFADVILPRLNIVQSIGQLKDTFTQGAIVFNQATTLFTPAKIDPKTGNAVQQGTPPLTVYVVGVISDRFTEVVKGGFGGALVDTEEAVRNLGGTLNYAEYELKQAAGMKRFQPITDLLMLVQRPEVVKDDGIIFNWKVEGNQYALAAWSLKGSAYTDVMKRVFNYHRLTGILRDGFPTYSFALSTRNKPFQNGNSAFVPVVVPIAKTSEPVLSFIHEVAGTPS